MANELAPSNFDPTLGGYTPGQGPVASQSAPLAPAKDTKPKAEAPSPKPDKGNVIPFPGMDTGSGGAEAAMAAIGRLEHERQNTPPPKLERPQKPQTSTDDIQLFGALAIAFAGIASLRTRQPLTTALNAMASGLNGMQQASKERVDQAYKQWEMDTKFAFETFDYEQKVYSDLMSNFDHREEAVAREWNMFTAERKMKFDAYVETMRDPVAAQAYQQGGLSAVADLFRQREETATKTKLQVEQIKKETPFNIEVEFLKKTPKFQNATPDEQLQMIEAVAQKTGGGRSVQIPYDEKKVMERGEAVLRYDQPLSRYETGLIGRSDFGQAVADYVTEHGQATGFREGNYQTVNAVTTDLAKGQGGQTIKSLVTMARHMDTFEELLKKVPLTGGPQAANEFWKEVARRFTNNPDINDAEAAATALAGEFNKVLVGGAGALADREGWQKEFSIAQTPESMRNFLGTMRELVQARFVGEINRLSPWVKPEKYIPKDVMERFGVERSDGTVGGEKEGADGASKAGSTEDSAIPLTQEAWDSAPSGTWFVGKNGTTRRQKP
jgi:hypothetical protein